MIVLHKERLISPNGTATNFGFINLVILTNEYPDNRTILKCKFRHANETCKHMKYAQTTASKTVKVYKHNSRRSQLQIVLQTGGRFLLRKITISASLAKPRFQFRLQVAGYNPNTKVIKPSFAALSQNNSRSWLLTSNPDHLLVLDNDLTDLPTLLCKTSRDLGLCGNSNNAEPISWRMGVLYKLLTHMSNHVGKTPAV